MKASPALCAALCAAVMLPACKPRQAATAEHPVQQGPVHPAWMDARPVDDAYYIGIGYCPKARADYQETAKKNALNDLASEISVTVEGNSLLYTLDRKYKFEEEYTSSIRTTTKERLEGYELVDSYDDDKAYWVYYRLAKADYARQKAERKQQALGQATDLYRRAAPSLAAGDLKTAFGLDLRALIAIKDYWGENDQVAVDGRDVPLANELFNDLQKMTSGVRLAVLPERCALNWANRFRREMLVSANLRDNGRALVQLPLVLSFPGSGGPVSEYRNTDGDGRLRTTVQRVDLRGPAPQWTVRLDLEALAGKDLDPAVTGALLASLTAPEIQVPIDLTMPKVVVRSSETNLGTALPEAPLALALKNELTALGFPCVEREVDADLAVEITASTRETGESNGFFTVALDEALKVRDRRGGDVVYAGGKQGLKGIQLSYLKAGLDAYQKAAADLRNAVMPAMIDAILQH